MGVIMYKNNRYAGGGSADPSLHFDWSNQTLPQTGDTNTIYCIPTGDTSDPWDFYAWNDTDEEFVKIDFNMTISIDSALSDTSTNPVQNKVVKGAIDAKADNTQTFTEASTRVNIASGETFAVILGKIKKFFTDLKAVAFSGSYNDLSDQPTIPAAQVNSDWNASSGVAQILNKPTIPDTSTFMQKGVDRVTAGQLSGSTLGTRATAEGYDITASGLNSHGEGSGTTAEGENSHAEGNWTFATGFASHTEGEATHATQSYSHAEGYHSTASGNSSHAEGYYSTASGIYSHVEGSFSTASGSVSHAEGYNNVASGNYSHAEGYQTKASSDYQHTEGKYNVEDANGTYAHIIGGGTANNARKNIFTVNWDGDVNAGRSNGLTNDTKLPTGADVISYLNSNFVVGKGNYNLAHCICAGYVTGSGNYINFFVPLLIDRDVTSITLTASPSNPHEINFYCKSANYSFSDIDTSGFSVISRRKNGLRLELKFKTTKTASEFAVVVIYNLTLTFA